MADRATRIRPWARLTLALVVWLGLAGCESMAGIVERPEVRCGRFERPGCGVLVDLGLRALGRPDEEPLIVAVGAACPDNARCLPSLLGGEEAAVVVRWADGTVDWASIPLPADWPAGAPGGAVARDRPVPDHLGALVGVGG